MQKTNMPEIIIRSTFIKNELAHVWVPIWVSQPGNLVKINSFMKRTQFDTWEANYFFDTTFTGIKVRNETYLTIDAKKIIFILKIPKKFRIVNQDDVKLRILEVGYIVTKELRPGDSFHLVPS